MPNLPCDDPTLVEWHAIGAHLIHSIERRGLSYTQFDQVWATLRPDAITIFSHQRESGRGVWNVKKSYLPHYVYFDRTGYSGWAEIASNEALFHKSQRVGLRRAEDFHRLLQQEYVAANLSKWQQPDTIFTPPGKPYIFYAMQNPGDTVMQLAYIDWLTLLESLVAYAARHDIILVVKRHPKCTDPRVTEALARYAGHPNVMSVDATIHSIIKNAQAVFVVNGGVGFESLMHLKPVYTAGKSDYHWVTHVLTAPQQLMALPYPPPLPVPEMTIKKFLYYFCRHYLVDVRDGRRTNEMVGLALGEYRWDAARQLCATAGRWLESVRKTLVHSQRTELLSPRMMDDGQPATHFAQSQLVEKRRFEADWPHVLKKQSCMTCGSRRFLVISHKERHGFYYPTGICRECGNIQQTRYYAPEVLSAFYAFYYRDIYGAPDPAGLFERQYRKSAAIYAFCEPHVRPGQSVLEIGCGAGGILHYFREKGMEVDGIDMNREYLEYGRSQGLNLMASDIQGFTADKRYDCIILSHVVQRFTQPRKIMPKILALLNPGGVIYIEVPSIHCVPSSYGDLLVYLQNAHYAHFSVHTLDNLLQALGLNVLRMNNKIQCLVTAGGRPHGRPVNYFNTSLAELTAIEHDYLTTRPA